MFGLIKTLIVVVLLFGGILVGLAYLPEETTAKVGSQAAGLLVKGCRGGSKLYASFKTKWEKAKLTGEGAADDAVTP